MMLPNQLIPANTSPIEAQRRLRAAAAHEAGHLTGWERFGYLSDGFLEAGFDFSIQDAFVVSLKTPQKPSGLNRNFELSVVGWCGVVSEGVLGFPLRPTPDVPELTDGTLNLWYSEILKRFDCLSEGDRCAIRKWPVDIRGACFFAYRLLTSPLGSIVLAKKYESLSEKFREQYSQIRPGKSAVGKAAEAFASKCIFG